MNVSTEKLTWYIKEQFYQTTDLITEIMDWLGEPAILCYFSVIMEEHIVHEQLELLKRAEEKGNPQWGISAVSTITSFSLQELREEVSSGKAVVVYPKKQEMLILDLPSYPVRSPEEPDNEHVIRGAHEGFVESINTNLGLLRKRLEIPELVVKNIVVGSKTKTQISYLYIENLVDKGLVEQLEERLSSLDTEMITSAGQLEDYIEDHVWSPFPQLLNTERPDRAVSNLLEGRIAIFTDHTPTCLITPISFFSFYQSPDDFNGRVIVGSFYRLVRLFSFMMALFLPAIYISVIGFHAEILPIELSQSVKMAIYNIPYRPIIEAIILELFIELIREASIRLPTPIGQTIGIVGGLVIGDAIVRAGLVSNLMVIIVAMTAISSFVVPSVEMNTTIRVLRFPFMLFASLFGFFGMAIASLLLFIHVANLSSLKQPYLSPIVPFEPSRLKNIFFRVPYFKATQVKKKTKNQSTVKE